MPDHKVLVEQHIAGRREREVQAKNPHPYPTPAIRRNPRSRTRNSGLWVGPFTDLISTDRRHDRQFALRNPGLGWMLLETVPSWLLDRGDPLLWFTLRRSIKTRSPSRRSHVVTSAIST